MQTRVARSRSTMKRIGFTGRNLVVVTEKNRPAHLNPTPYQEIAPMARRKGHEKLDPELKHQIKALRKKGYIVYLTAAGDLGYAPMVRGAKKGHLVKPHKRRCR